MRTASLTLWPQQHGYSWRVFRVSSSSVTSCSNAYFSGLWVSASSWLCCCPSCSSSFCIWLCCSASLLLDGLRRYSSSSALIATFSGISHLLKCSIALKTQNYIRLVSHISELFEIFNKYCGIHIIHFILPFIHFTTLEELGGLGIMEKSIPALLLSLRQRTQHLPGCNITGVSLQFLQTVLWIKTAHFSKRLPWIQCLELSPFVTFTRRWGVHKLFRNQPTVLFNLVLLLPIYYTTG